MLVHSLDTKKLISFTLHTGAPLTDGEVETILTNIDAMANALADDPKAHATTVVIVDAESGPSAKQRQRIGEASRKIKRGYQVLVTRSTLVRAIMTAIRWFSPANEKNQHASFATWPEARAW